MIHAKVEFAKGEGAERVSTNAVEGLFSQVKKHLRKSNVSNITKDKYGIYVGEYRWRERLLFARAFGTSSWRDDAFWLISDTLGLLREKEHRRDL